MTDDTKQEIEVVLMLLKQTLITNGVSIAVEKENGALNFFDTEEYLRTEKFQGIRVGIEELVR